MQRISRATNESKSVPVALFHNSDNCKPPLVKKNHLYFVASNAGCSGTIRFSLHRRSKGDFVTPGVSVPIERIETIAYRGSLARSSPGRHFFRSLDGNCPRLH